MLELIFAVDRFLLYAAAIQLFGIAVFVSILAPAMSGAIAAPLRGVAIACAAILAATSLVWLCIEAGSMGNGWADALSPSTLRLVLSSTQFGHAWLAVLALDVLLVVAIAAPSRFRWPAIAVLSAAALAALGLVGHVAAAEGWIGMAGQASQAVHLVAGGFWLGSLLPLALCLRSARRPEMRAQAEMALTRFSGLGHLAVALVLATGLSNTLIVLGHLPLDLASPYELLLAVKIGLVAVMIGLALLNRYRLLPRLRHDGPRRLLRAAIAESAIGAVVILVVSVLGILPMA